MTTPDQKLFLAELVDNMHDAILGANTATLEQLRDLRSAIDPANEGLLDQPSQQRLDH